MILLVFTDDDSKSWQQSLSRDMDSNNIHFVDPGRDENVLLPMQHSYMVSFLFHFTTHLLNAAVSAGLAQRETFLTDILE